MKPITPLDHDTAYVYDMLAIACIKTLNNPEDHVAMSSYVNLEATLRSYHGEDDHQVIVVSDEFKHLYQVNQEMYVRINEMKLREPTGEDAKYIDDRVYQRFLAKRALQEKFFPSSPLTETKHGYNVEQKEDKKV